MICTHHQMIFEWSNKTNNMGVARGTYGGQEMCIQDFGGETWRKETTWKIGDNIKMNLQEVEWEDMDLIDLAQGRGVWRAVVNTAMNLRVS
jgi:hypothetical protein